jgi:DNA-binding NarL/FixJ family response regulator
MEALIHTLNTLPVSAAVLDASGTIVAVNDTWKEFGRRNGLGIPDWGVGASYLKYSGGKGRRSTRFVRDLKELLAGRLDLLTAIYPCHSPDRKRWFLLVGVPFPLEKPTGAALLHVNLTTMLQVPMTGRGRQDSTAASARGSRAERAHHSPAQLKAIGDVVERSVSETLSAQIMAMLAGRISARQQGAPFVANQGLVPSDARPEAEQNAADPGALGAAARVLESEAVPEDPDLDGMIARAGLSKRQVEVLRLLGKGMTNREIAEALFRSPHTIKLHVSAILERLKLKSRTQAALLASKL